ncbi:hypothetical protein [Devosia psychrophila]|uniref:Uncharacterized protein n=1 Tax=Devosia psychrophila TaxID=728005 RepID=A0A0F5Q165_9HYPH|nr:hypothetical protein [Devosia psychrophila]KKC34600.1 hypothetical protein WH91_01750 [Devosia psychrophila]SFD00399.1 hypothetical protein SAMN04488059_11730 [Devosia psychrophila]
MSTLNTRIEKLERELAPVGEPRRNIEVLSGREMTSDELHEWLRGQGVEVQPDDRIFHRIIVGVEPGTMRRIYSGKMERLSVTDFKTGETTVRHYAEDENV